VISVVVALLALLASAYLARRVAQRVGIDKELRR
jgi:hypothetical protein